MLRLFSYPLIMNYCVAAFRKYRFEKVEPPFLKDNSGKVLFFQECSFRRVESRIWLIKRRLAIVLIWLGVVGIIIGTVSLQVAKNIRLSSLDCKEVDQHCTDILKWARKFYSIGVSSIGFGLMFILTMTFVFLHTYLIYYEGSVDNKDFKSVKTTTLSVELFARKKAVIPPDLYTKECELTSFSPPVSILKTAQQVPRSTTKIADIEPP